MNHTLAPELATIRPTTDNESRLFSLASATADLGVVYRSAHDGHSWRVDVASFSSPGDLRLMAHLYSTLASRMEALQRARQAARGTDAPLPPGG